MFRAERGRAWSEKQETELTLLRAGAARRDLRLDEVLRAGHTLADELDAVHVDPVEDGAAPLELAVEQTLALGLAGLGVEVLRFVVGRESPDGGAAASVDGHQLHRRVPVGGPLALELSALLRQRLDGLRDDVGEVSSFDGM